MTRMSLQRKRRSASGLFFFATLLGFTNVTLVKAQDTYFRPTSFSDPSASETMPYFQISENPADGGGKPTEREAAMPDSGDEQSNSTSAGQSGNSGQTQEELRLQAAGQIAFHNSCVECHDAEKSLSKYKSLASWRATVARMACQDGADIPTCDREPIAVYLASRNASSGAGTSAEATRGDSFQETMDSSVPEVTVFGTISPTLRTHGTEVQNQGFFGDVWAGIAYQPNSGPLSAKMVACISCHNEHDEGYLSRLEIVQASLTLNLGQIIRGETGTARGTGRRKSNGSGVCTASSATSCLPASQLASDNGNRQIEAFVEAGRMVVPFGAFSSQVNPGVYRTVSRPLMFNMGQRVYEGNLGDPVLPMPFSDEGADLNIVVPMFDSVSLNIDAYVVNGLQGSNNINFDDSRDYVDNNKSPAVGGRMTLGNSTLKVGSSIIGGQYNANTGTGPNARGLNFLIYGADVSYRYKDILRVQAEFAQRNTQSFYDLAVPQYAQDKVSGYYVESELLLSRSARLSTLCRWDEQRQKYGAFDDTVGTPSATFNVNRMTYGLNWTMPGGSLLMFNVEHWYLPSGFHDTNVVGMRWAATF